MKSSSRCLKKSGFFVDQKKRGNETSNGVVCRNVLGQRRRLPRVGQEGRELRVGCVPERAWSFVVCSGIAGRGHGDSMSSLEALLPDISQETCAVEPCETEFVWCLERRGGDDPMDIGAFGTDKGKHGNGKGKGKQGQQGQQGQQGPKQGFD